MTAAEQKELRLFAVKVREGILRGTHAAKSGHPGGSLSSTEYFTYLYNRELRVDPKNPHDPNRDRFVLSKGHVAPGLYATLANRGFFPVEELLTLRHIDSRLQGHPNMNLTPGVDMSTGSLGQGISTAAGMAKGAKYLGKDINVYTLLGDGELAEGQVWEALMFSAHFKLDNLCIAVDINGLQIDGATADVMNTAPVDKKFEAFGCAVISIDGHDYNALEEAFKTFHANKGTGKPTAILMKTVKGKDISFMENKASWHGKAPNDDELAQGLEELAAIRKAIEEA
ncbi:transketolase [Centipeda periodontii DSM 2778]|jgi:transketolase|uniref:Transketolase n=1 Tax=Centipeda periodontii DSM 2778 TaxID=888060 RepID=F5RME6_9FIRM|nr:transketolase [Centipeda periodontii]EGK59837.1 transketolase [Centipeda periodontii DSM 2778]